MAEQQYDYYRDMLNRAHADASTVQQSLNSISGNLVYELQRLAGVVTTLAATAANQRQEIADLRERVAKLEG